MGSNESSELTDKEPGGTSVAGLLPGPAVALLLATVNRADVSDHELIEQVKAWERLASWVAAGQINALTEFARRRPAATEALDVDEFAHNELALALTLSPLTAQRRLAVAVATSERLPAALDALTEGRIDYARLNTIHDETQELTDDQAAELAAEILAGIDEKPLTNGQVRHRLKKRVARERSRSENEKAQREAARKRQAVELLDFGDGNAELRARLSSGDGAVAMAILNSAAHQALTPGDTRTVGQRRVAALMDLLTGRSRSSTDSGAGTGTNQGSSSGANTHGSTGASAGASASQDVNVGADGSAEGEASAPDDEAGRAGPRSTGSARTGDSDLDRTTGHAGAATARTIVNVTIPYSEFLRLADLWGLRMLGATARMTRSSSPGEIEGPGAVPGWVVRDLVTDVMTAPGTGFRAVVYDDVTGELRGLSSTRYVPPKAMADHVRHRDVTCRFPGCRRAARRCDVDHAQPWAQGGSTKSCNLQCLCRHHHRLKQNPAWRVRYLGGFSQWTAPTGHTYASWPYDWRDPLSPDEIHDDAPPPDEPPPDLTAEDRPNRPLLREQMARARARLAQCQIPDGPLDEPGPERTEPPPEDHEQAPDDHDLPPEDYAPLNEGHEPPHEEQWFPENL
jgi:Domain of unknown function (DUF222)